MLNKIIESIKKRTDYLFIFLITALLGINEQMLTNIVILLWLGHLTVRDKEIK